MGEEWFHVKKRIKSISPVQLIVLSFAVVILTGTLLLMLPAVSRSGEHTSLIDALFTSTSATCVTGLVVFDTWTHWNIWGQIVIIALIQVGGLGVITFTTGFTLLVHRKLALHNIQLATENTAGDTIHIARLVKMILAFTAGCETLGTCILMLRFVPQFGVRGVWVALFTAISAFCNAGFDVLGFLMKDGNLIPYVEDPLVCLTVGALIVVGGLGFIVVSDIYHSRIVRELHGEKPERLNFHSDMVLLVTAFLIVSGATLFLLCEYDNTLVHNTFGGKLNASLFQSISARTAGFASVNIARERDITKVITIILMFIGASPAGTGGGIKTTTFLVLAATVFSVMKGESETVVMKHRIERTTVYRALTICFSALLVILITTGVILVANPEVNGVDALFEATSGFGTVGLSAGVTQGLCSLSKFFVSMTMFVGRVGPVSLGLALTRHQLKRGVILPEGKLVVG